MKVVAIIQARLGSRRFPRKVLAPLKGKPVLQHVIERARQIEGVDHVSVACPASENKELFAAVWPDDGRHAPFTIIGPLVPENDVLGRFREAAEHAGADVIVRLTADCPSLSTNCSSRVLEAYLNMNRHAERFVSNDVARSGYPDGWDTEVFSRDLLELAHAEAYAGQDREHVTPWMRRQTSVQQLTVYMPGEPWPGPKLSIDTPADLALLEELMP